MAELEYLNKILEVERIAENIEFTAKSERKERISIAKDKAKEILIKAKWDADAKYKEEIVRIKEDGENKLKKDRQEALSEAQKLKEHMQRNKENTVRKIAERIVSCFADN